MDIYQHNDKSILLNEMKRLCDKIYIGDDYLYSYIDYCLVIAKKLNTTELQCNEEIVDEDFASYHGRNVKIVSIYNCKYLTELKTHHLKNTIQGYCHCYKTISPAFYKAMLFIDGKNKHWYDNGCIKNIYYTNKGLINGTCKKFYKNKRICEISNWKNGLLDGLYELFFDGNIVLNRKYYKDNIEIEKIEDYI